MPIIAIYVLIATVIFAAGAGSGWTVHSWRTGAEIEQLRSRDAVVSAANAECATDIEGVRKGVAEIQQAADEREQAADTAMRKAKVAAARHAQAAREIHNAPAVPVTQQCQAIESEQIEYVAARHASE